MLKFVTVLLEVKVPAEFLATPAMPNPAGSEVELLRAG